MERRSGSGARSTILLLLLLQVVYVTPVSALEIDEQLYLTAGLLGGISLILFMLQVFTLFFLNKLNGDMKSLKKQQGIALKEVANQGFKASSTSLVPQPNAGARTEPQNQQQQQQKQLPAQQPNPQHQGIQNLPKAQTSPPVQQQNYPIHYPTQQQQYLGQQPQNIAQQQQYPAQQQQYPAQQQQYPTQQPQNPAHKQQYPTQQPQNPRPTSRGDLRHKRSSVPSMYHQTSVTDNPSNPLAFQRSTRPSYNGHGNEASRSIYASDRY